ncbi:hypothetical protein X925_02535 [Petrotoga sp. 9T1HF07.CasAA.8.2]|nr:hypothetical protein X925_02535 [Petrotoga sp. 9T1HF07.CasAA.8.2]
MLSSNPLFHETFSFYYNILLLSFKIFFHYILRKCIKTKKGQKLSILLFKKYGKIKIRKLSQFLEEGYL